MAIISTLYTLPQAVISNASGVAGWVNPNNILLPDSDYAVSSGPAQIMTVGNFSFANPDGSFGIPQGATILNIYIRVKGYRGSFNTTLNIYAVDDTSGVSYAYPYMPPFQGFDGTNTAWTLTPTLFATTWTPDQINNLKVKLIADGELHMDCIDVSIVYEDNIVPAPVSSGSGEVVCNEYVQAQPFQLARAFNADHIYAFVTSFNYARPSGIIEPILIGDFYGEAILVVDQGNPNEETFEITNIEHDYQGTGLTRLTTALTDRGLRPKYPYTHDITRVYNHSGTAEVVISNSARFYDRFLKKCQIDALVSAPIYVEDEDVELDDPVHILDFKGAGVSVVNDGTDSNKKIITIPGNGVNPATVSSTSSATSGGTQVPTLTWSHVSSGIDRLLVVQVETEAAATVSGVTFNGDALTLGVTTTNGTLKNQQWYRVAPDVGSYNIVITVSPNAYITAGAQTFNGVNQSTPIGATNGATGTSLAPSVVLNTTVDNSVVVDSLATGILPIAYTIGAGQVQNWKIVTSPSVRQGASSVESAGTQPDAVTMSWAMTQNTAWAINAMEIIGISAPVSADEKVKVSAADTTPGYLNNKMTIGSSNSTVTITPSITNPGADEVKNFDMKVTKNNLSATTNPSTGNDDTEGYSIGSLWFNKSTNTLFVASDVSTGAAVWDTVSTPPAPTLSSGPFSIASLATDSNASTAKSVLATTYDVINNSIYVLILNTSGGPSYSLTVNKYSQDSVSGLWTLTATNTQIGLGSITAAGLCVTGSGVSEGVVVIFNSATLGNNIRYVYPLDLSTVTTASVNPGVGYVFQSSGLYTDGDYYYFFATDGVTPKFIQVEIATGTPTGFTLSGFAFTQSDSLYVDIANNLVYITEGSVTVRTCELSGGVITQLGSYSLSWTPYTVEILSRFPLYPLIYGISGLNILTLMSYPIGYLDVGPSSTLASANQMAQFLSFEQA